MSEKQPTMKDTKQAILDAYNRVYAKLKEIQGSKFDPKAEMETKTKNELVSRVDEILTGKSFDEAFSSIKAELEKLAVEIVNKTKVYADIDEAIKIKEDLLKELGIIETDALSLYALVNTREELARKYDEEHAERVAKANKELEELKNKHYETQKEFAKQQSEEKARISQERKREQEEFEYKFAREKQQKMDELNDEILQKQKEFNEKCEKFTAELNAREKELDVREENLVAREEKINDLEATIDSLKENQETVVSEAVAKARSEERSKFYAERNSIEKEAEHKVAIIQNKLEISEQALTKANETIETLNEKLEKAYAEIREMANKTIEASANKQVINQLERLASQNQKAN